MPDRVLHHAGTVRIDGKDYRLVRTDDQSVTFRREYSNEPPWASGTPSMVSEPVYTWHQGGFKSRQGLAGTSEYGQNTDTRWPFRLLPASAITTITLTGSTSTPTAIFEALGRIWILAGRFVYRVNPSDDTVVQSRDFGATVLTNDGLRWESDFGLVTTNEATNSLWKVTALGSPDTWTQTTSVEAWRLAAGINRLFKIETNGTLKNIGTGLDPMVDTNYADSVQVGETGTKPTALLAYERTVFAGKPEGLFGVGEEGFGVPLIRKMALDDRNCLGAAVVEPWVYIPHSRGLYRFLPGLVESVGIEKEILSESPVRGRVTAIIGDGQWIYIWVRVSATVTYLLVARERRGGEPGFGPLILDTFAYYTDGTDARTEAAFLGTTRDSSLALAPRLWFGRGVNVAYINLSLGFGAPDVLDSAYRFATTNGGNRFSPKLRFDDWNPKDFSKINLAGKNLSSTKFWDLAYSIDGGAFLTTDIDGNNMRINSDGLKTFILPTSAVGREIQYRLTWTSDSSTVPPELNYFEAFAVPQSKKLPLLSMMLLLQDGIRHDESVESRSAAEQFSDLQTLVEGASAVVASGPWGESFNCWARSLRLLDTIQSGDGEHGLVIDLALQHRESS